MPGIDDGGGDQENVASREPVCKDYAVHMDKSLCVIARRGRKLVV